MPTNNWSIDTPDNFYKKQIRSLPISAQKKLQSIMHAMIPCNDPKEFGTWKNTKYGPAYVADLNDSYRLAYLVDFDARVITIIRAGDHKEVYGKD
jgi:mRNA-degrading endonuclease RelE of RelBE toxin-antitoxin system